MFAWLPLALDAAMTGHTIERRKTMERFLEIVEMKHSQEMTVLEAEALEAMGPRLAEAEKEIRAGLGLRATRRKSDEWKVEHTIDLITLVLESWGNSTVEKVVTRPRVDGKPTRKYALHINQNNTLWENIYNYNMITDDFLITL